jgi:autotransporter-associated beta strand protein
VYNGSYIAPFSPIPAFVLQTPYGGGGLGIKFDPYNNLIYEAGGGGAGAIYKLGGGGYFNILNTPASFSANTGGACDAVYNPVNSMLYVGNTTNGIGIEVHNPATNYSYVTSYGSTWGMYVLNGIDIEPISGYIYVTDPYRATFHTGSSIGANHNVVSSSGGIGIKVNNRNGKIYNAGGAIHFDPFAWSSPGTSYLMSLPLNQNLKLNAGYNLTMSSGTLPGVSGSITGLGASPTAGMGVLSLNAGSTLTLAGGILTPDINQGIVMNTGILVDQNNSTLNFPMTVIAPSTITSNGGNTLKLAGTTTINNTTLTLNGAGITKITGNITGTGTLNVNGNINFANTVMFGGSINLSSGTPSLTANQIWGSIQGSAPLTMNNYMITLGADNTNQTYSGSLTGTGVIYKNGTGIQTFTGNLSGFTGMIVVSHGEVIINSSTPFGGKIINESTINTKNNTVINGDFVSSGTFIVG